MHFIKEENPNGSYTIKHYSGDRYIQTITEDHRHWPTYLEQLDAGLVQTIDYVCPWNFTQGQEQSDSSVKYLRNDGCWVDSTDQSVLDFTASGHTLSDVTPYTPPSPPTLETIKSRKIIEIDNATEEYLDSNGVTIDFDFGDGVVSKTFAATKAASLNWLKLLNLATACLDSRIPEATAFPKNIQEFPTESLIELDTSARAFSFALTVQMSIETIRATQAAKKASLNSMATVEQVEAVDASVG